MHSRLIVLFVALTMLGGALPASGQDRDRTPVSRGVTETQAIQIARGYGMVQVQEIERDDGGWEIEGRDHRGRELEIDINREGRVIRIERGDDDDDE